MTILSKAAAKILSAQKKSNKPLAVILAGHNGSGKSTLWYGELAANFQIPLKISRPSSLCERAGTKRRQPKQLIVSGQDIKMRYKRLLQLSI